MTKRATFWTALLAAALGLMACGDSNNSSSACAGITPSTECRSVCESPCVGVYLPAGTVDDCICACEMDAGGFQMCLTELTAAIECLETISCGTTGSPACLPQSQALTTCLGG